MTTVQTIYLKDYRPPNFLIKKVHLHFDLYEDHTVVKSILEIERNPAVVEPNAPLILNGEQLALQQVLLDGTILSENAYKVDENSLTLFAVPQQFRLETVVHIKPQENLELMGLYKSRSNFCTQCEAEGFRRITYFLDRPDVMTHFVTGITADKNKYPYLLSNGNLIDQKELANNRHWVLWEDPSLKPCYLFALVAGDFDVLEDHYVTLSERTVQLKLFIEKGYADQGGYAMQALKKAMHWDEQTYGREYDLDIYMIVAVSDFNMGAMENKGLNVFNTKYVLARPDTATDTDYINIDRVIGHEYFHNWTGNRITCRDWFQLTLKEGLTVFRDQTFTEDVASYTTRLDEISVVRNQQFLEDAGPTAHPIRPSSYVEINNFYTLTVYRKGAEVIRMIRTLMGEQKFLVGMDLYFGRYDGQAVTTDDFVAAMSDGGQYDLTQFKRWYDQAGTPLLTISSEYDASNHRLLLTVQQSCAPTADHSPKQPFHLPLAIGLVGPQCADLPTQLKDETNAQAAGTRILEIKQPTQTFEFVNLPQKPVLSLLRGFSAPVKIQYDYSNEELLWLLRCDSDPFARWDAGQLYMQRLIFKLMAQHQQQQTLVMDAALVEAFQKILNEPGDDLLFSARLLGLPALSYLCQQTTPADVDGLFAARQFLQRELGVQLEREWHQAYERSIVKHYDYNMVDAGKRSMRNTSLFYLTEVNKTANFSLAYDQFNHTDNMTDAMGALIALNNHNVPLRDQALEEFYRRWKDQPLVVNKWLSLQASTTLPNALEQVKHCLTHPGYNAKNPNNIYALICGFGANTIRFHDRSGAGYEFVADQVLATDQFNPQAAARVFTPFLHWKLFDAERQALMQAQLQRILNTPNISKDVFEMAEKSVKA